MQIISTREFRTHQKHYLDLAETETIFITRRNSKPFIVKTADEQDMLTLQELQSIRSGIEDIRAGRVKQMMEGESLAAFLDRVEGNV